MSDEEFTRTSYTITVNCKCGDVQTFDDPPFPCHWICPDCGTITVWTSASDTYWRIPDYVDPREIKSLNEAE